MTDIIGTGLVCLLSLFPLLIIAVTDRQIREAELRQKYQRLGLE